MWRDEENSRHKIGQLWREGGGFRFVYEAMLPTTFKPLAEFPEHRDETRPYESNYLFATFAERIPSPKRHDAQSILESWGVEHPDDHLEILARSGGIQVTDWIELSEWRAPDDDLSTPLLVRVAGTRHHPGASIAMVGDEVLLRR